MVGKYVGEYFPDAVGSGTYERHLIWLCRTRPRSSIKNNCADWTSGMKIIVSFPDGLFDLRPGIYNAKEIR